jgi:hypothetical protein
MAQVFPVPFFLASFQQQSAIKNRFLRMHYRMVDFPVIPIKIAAEKKEKLHRELK